MSKPVLYVKEVKGKGRAVFSTTAIAENDLIEECPLIVLSPADFDIVTSTEVVNYCFFFDKEEKILALAMGFGSLYNHAFPSNAHHMIDKETKTITIFALRDIKANEEICINYTGDPDNDSTEWFSARNIEYRK
jgi:SET domain-containing protein